MKHEILAHLPTDYPWKEHFHYYPTLDSTNETLRRLAKQGAPHGTVIAAGHQTNGHGRRGRSFQSPEGMGIYLSILLRPKCTPKELMHLTCATAVAMCNAIEAAAGFRPGIKWTNDLVYEKRKLGGILTELGFTPKGEVSYAIIGIGINCLQASADFPPEIRDIAGSLSMVTERPISISHVASAMMDALHQMDKMLLSGKPGIMDSYRRDCITLGQYISLVRGSEIRHGTAIELDEDGALLVRFSDGHTEVINSGEVSIRGMYGYV